MIEINGFGVFNHFCVFDPGSPNLEFNHTGIAYLCGTNFFRIRGETSNLTLVGGFIGTAAIHGKYTNTTVALRPAIGWTIFNGPN